MHSRNLFSLGMWCSMYSFSLFSCCSLFLQFECIPLLDFEGNILLNIPVFQFDCSWLNTTMTENRKILDGSDLDGFDKVNDNLLFAYV